MFHKIAIGQGILRTLSKPKYVLPALGAAGVMAGAHTIASGLQKGREYKAGFDPGVFESGGH